MSAAPPGSDRGAEHPADALERLSFALQELRATAARLEVPSGGAGALTQAIDALADALDAAYAERTHNRHDPLTGLPDRGALHEALRERLAAGAEVGLLYIDFDRFRRVNDALGHDAGDRLMAAAAQRLQGIVDAGDLIGRHGGDEFLLVCEGVRALAYANAVHAAFGEPFHIGGEAHWVTPSIGIALGPAHGHDPAALIRCADLAMYECKRSGRLDWCMYEPALGQRHRARLRLDSQLRQAMRKGEFRLVYQPQVDLASNQLVGAEALIRWHNPALGEMRPDRFITHVERSDVMAGLGRWVLAEACRQMRAWRDAGLALPRVAVNVSSRQLLGDDLARDTHAALRDADLPGEALELELTERVLVEDLPDTTEAFAALRALGVVLTIDDFGEGYSALEYLRRLPIHGLKLSKLFVDGVPETPSDVAVCRAVHGIAHHLGLELVVEGVEREQQRAFLLDIGVRRAQGFLFSPGLSGDDFLAYARTLPSP